MVQSLRALRRFATSASCYVLRATKNPKWPSTRLSPAMRKRSAQRTQQGRTRRVCDETSAVNVTKAKVG